jgi:hypothetical protein
MHVAVFLRGRSFYHTNIYHTDFSESCDNINEMILEPLRKDGHIVDIFCCTYISHKIEHVINFYKPVKTIAVNDEDLASINSWNRQMIFSIEGLRLLKAYESTNNIRYDYCINLRFDILFKTPISEQNIDIKKFNIMFKHTSGNCDDNYWIIGREYFNLFEESLIKMLNKKDAITHELNHYIKESNINYMYETDSNEYRYYSFTRTNNY